MGRARRALGWIGLAGIIAWLSPAVPVIIKYGALPTKGSGINLVVAGVDVDYDTQAATWPYPAKPTDFSSRTDTLMLAQFSSGKVNILSIPRDSWVYIPQHGYGKINAANVYGGAERLMQTVQGFTGIDVDGVIYLSLNAVKDITDALGGVWIDVPINMKYDDNAGHLHINLKKGYQRLNGQQAEGFLRFRHDAQSDIGRVGRQQLFSQALIAQIKHPKNWWRLPMLISAAERNTKTTLTRTQIGQLFGAAIGGLQMNSATVPGNFGRGGTWAVNDQKLRQVLNSFQRSSQVLALRGMRIGVVNIDAPPGSAARLKARLEAQGFENVEIVSEHRGPTSISTVAGTNAAQFIKMLGYGKISQKPSADGYDITIRLGSDAQ